MLNPCPWWNRCCVLGDKPQEVHEFRGPEKMCLSPPIWFCFCQHTSNLILFLLASIPSGEVSYHGMEPFPYWPWWPFQKGTGVGFGKCVGFASQCKAGAAAQFVHGMAAKCQQLGNSMARGRFAKYTSMRWSLVISCPTWQKSLWGPMKQPMEMATMTTLVLLVN